MDRTYEVTLQADLPGNATEVDPLQPRVPAPGMVLRDRFVLQRMLGAGGMSKVFLALDRELEDSNPYVAIKVLGDTFKDHPQALTSLRREVNNSRQLNHPNIVGVYHFDRDGDIVFMVMEFMRGEPLDEFLRKYPEGLPWDRAWHIIRSCGEALAYMHDHGVVHSDFKPGNVFLTENNEVKVLDLGIARTLDEAMATRNTTRFDGDTPLALTPQYASCEMFEGQSPDRRDDIYALGCVAYLLLTGRHPFDGARAIDARSNGLEAERPPGLRQGQWQVLLQSLAHRRRERVANAREFLAGFGPATSSRNATPWIAVSALLFATGIAAASWQAYQDSPEQRFIDELLVQYRDTGNPSVDGKQVALWLEQGAQNITMANTAFASDEFDRGGYFLHGSTSSAKWVYDLVLRQAPDEASKRAAAGGLLQLASAYEEPAQRLDELQRSREALDFACRGVAINAHNPVLREVLPSLLQKVSNPGAIAGCKALPEGMLP
ncbi:serine/threonine-protein kinase [Haliea sp. E1-2-M8]|uniref:serine/threonine-protein kinase n=1 Tax=Haliea sp. E1-2-M8 TaxID=3064706 RepID=UPI002723AEFD|nr:serine/threonine-protein kinase [Haliea sp. E1-2-M8]MDO8861022.1 serine/threonine-protein kinase [Haliea sp. E1-2-M8]